MKRFAMLAVAAALCASAHAQHGASASNMVLLGHIDLQAVNPLTGQREANGTSIVDVTDPRNLTHIPGEEGVGEAGGAQMVRVCNGSDLPKGHRSKVYLLRSGDFCARGGRFGAHSSNENQPPMYARRFVFVSNVEVDDRGHVYIVDRANTGMHILEFQPK